VAVDAARDFVLFGAAVALISVAWAGVRRLRAHNEDKAAVLRRLVGSAVTIEVPTGGQLQWNKTVEGVVTEVNDHGVVVREASGKERSLPLAAVRSVHQGRRRIGRCS
jgi:hypothetical protein